MTWRSALAVAIGGALGALSRWGIDGAIGSLEASTLAVNVLGAFALGVVMGHGLATRPDWLRDAVGVGLLGSFTTMSGVAVLALPIPDLWWVGYATATFALGLLAVVGGWRWGKALGDTP